MNLGNCYYDLNLYEETINKYDEALDITLTRISPKHRSLITIYNNMAAIYELMQNKYKSLEYLQKALKLQLEINEHKHLMTGVILSNIGETYFKAGEIHRALGYFEEALKIFEVQYSNNHPYIVKCNVFMRV